MPENINSIPAPENTVPIVPVEMLVPDIKPISEVVLDDKFAYSGNPFPDRFAVDVIRSSAMRAMLANQNEDIQAIREKFRNQVVVDLGAGDTCAGYFFSLALGSRGYVGVDRFQATVLKDGLEHFDENRVFNEWVKVHKEPSGSDAFKDSPEFKSEVAAYSQIIPASVIDGNMLAFLKRLPDNSVSIFTFGIDDMVLPSVEYREAVAQEIKRVLSKDGMYVTDSSSINSEGLKSYVYPGSIMKHLETKFFVKDKPKT